jgi:hypothetical protein
MFKKADIPVERSQGEFYDSPTGHVPRTNVVPGTGILVTIGTPSSGVNPAGCDCTPEKMTARRTAIPIVTALNVPRPPS